MGPNLLYYGDNLDVLRRHVKDESVDLVYLDPPFNSDATYNVLFKEHDDTPAAAQIEAFGDTWRWDESAAEAYEEVVEHGGAVSDALRGFRTLLGTSNLLAYLAMMAPRLIELQRVLKTTGSLYLHCDPTASHYLKVLLDAVFGPKNFRNEIVWRRTGAHGKAKRFGPIHDTILFYTRSDHYTWMSPTHPYMRGHVEEYFVKDEKGWRTNYYGNVLTGSGLRGGESGKPWRDIDPSAKGRHWAIPGALIADLDEDVSHLTQHQKLDRLYELGHIKIEPGQAWPIYERYIAPSDGLAIADIWAFQPYTGSTVFGTDEGVDEDVRWLSPRDQERLGYPTQKPEGLLQRIIAASSEPGGVVLDPFCGCGTTIAVAQHLERQWIGIDITHLAINLIRHRLQDTYGPSIGDTYSVIGEPVSVEDARQLATEDPYQFQWWALGLVGARGVEKKGADKGIDGRLFFHDEKKGGKTKQVILSVKAGKVTRSQVHELRGVVEREGAQIGVLISFNEPTKAMKEDAASAGFYTSEAWGKSYPRIQLVTVGELLEGKEIAYPHVTGVTFKKAPKAKTPATQTEKLFDAAGPLFQELPPTLEDALEDE